MSDEIKEVADDAVAKAAKVAKADVADVAADAKPAEEEAEGFFDKEFAALKLDIHNIIVDFKDKLAGK